MTERPLVKCPQCSERLQKLISQSAFHLKGSGWYATDYARKTNSDAAPAKKSEDKSTDTSSQTDKKSSE